MSPKKTEGGTGAILGGAPVPPEKSPSERLDEVNDKISDLEEERKELLFEVAKEEAAESDEVHSDCVTKETHQEVIDERDKADEHAADRDEIWEALVRFGGHAPDCLEGAVVGQKLHPRCTCGWNEYRTRVEAAGP